ncbi:TPA: tail fiber domain-containing protein, partial [Citrobacter freundii]
MSAGTLTLTNNSAAVSGSGTAFTTELAAGDFIVVTVGGIPYTLPVKSVESGTALTLVSNFTGPTQAGAAWSAVPRVALNMVTAALVAQSAEALRGLNYDKQNWQQVFSGTGTITVKLPDQSTFTGPSWKYLADNMATKSGGAVPVNQGGTGSTDESGAREKLGLGTAATKDTGTSPGQVLLAGEAFGLGGNLAGYSYSQPTGFYTG